MTDEEETPENLGNMMREAQATLQKEMRQALDTWCKDRASVLTEVISKEVRIAAEYVNTSEYRAYHNHDYAYQNGRLKRAKMCAEKDVREGHQTDPDAGVDTETPLEKYSEMCIGWLDPTKGMRFVVFPDDALPFSAERIVDSDRQFFPEVKTELARRGLRIAEERSQPWWEWVVTPVTAATTEENPKDHAVV